MRQPASELSDRFHLLALTERVLDALALGDTLEQPRIGACQLGIGRSEFEQPKLLLGQVGEHTAQQRRSALAL